MSGTQEGQPLTSAQAVRQLPMAQTGAGGAGGDPKLGGPALGDMSDEQLKAGYAASQSPMGSLSDDDLRKGYAQSLRDATPPMSGVSWDQYIEQAPLGRVLNAFGQGAKEGWGTGNFGLSDELTKALKGAGIFNDVEKSQRSIMGGFNEGLIRPAGAVLDLLYHTVGAVIRGGQAAVEQAGAEAGSPKLGRDIAALPEAFPAGFRQFGIPHPSIGEVAQGARARIYNPPLHAVLDEARSLRVIGAGEDGWKGLTEPPPATEAPVRAAVEEQREAEPAGADAPTPTPPRDVHEAARQIAPDTFQEYDMLANRRDFLRERVAAETTELRRRAEAQAPFAEEIADTERRLEGATPRLAKIYEERLGRMRPEHDAFLADEFTMGALTRDTPEVARLREQLQATDYRMRDLSPEVSAAYREAAVQFPVAEAARPAAPVEPAAAPAEVAPAAAPPTQPEAPVARPEPPREAAAPETVAAIAQDVAQRLVAAGRPAEEANAAGALLQAYYETRAARFGGAKGTAQELYAREGPDIRAGGVGGRGGAAAGKMRLPVRTAPTQEPARPTAPQQPPAAATPAAAAETPAATETAGAAVAAPERATGGIQALDPATIGVDAQRFQFKAGGDEAGVTERLAGVRQWDSMLAGTVIVWRDADGKNWIADGHQRLALAKRMQEAGQQDVRLNSFVLNAGEGVTAEQARALAAAKNIAEGTGTPIDAAKVIRHAQENGIDLPDLPPRSALVRDGFGLSRLGWEAFGAAVNDVVPANQAALIGRLVEDHAQQSEAIRLLAKLKPENARQAETVIREMLATGTEAGTQTNLFGSQDFASSIVLERAKIIDEAQRQLGRDRQTFRTLVSRAEEIQGEGNQLAGEANQRRLTTDEQATQLLQTLATTRGPVSDELSAIAREYKDGTITRADAARRFLGAVRRGVEEGVERGATPGGAGPGEASGRDDVGERTLLQQDRGATRFAARPIITLFAKADASTFLHETGHQWLEDLLADARDAQAPADLTTDAQTVRDWLGAKPEAAITTAQHEKFARGFERYMMEGIAPSRELAGVFDKFRQWLTKIYQSVLRLKAPITDDIRDVFDRLLSQNPEPTGVAPEPAPLARTETTPVHPESPPEAPRSATPPPIRTIQQIMAEDGVSAGRARRTQEQELVARADWQKGAGVQETAPATPESHATEELANIHQHDATETSPEQAGGVADEIHAERTEAVDRYVPEVAHGAGQSEPGAEAATGTGGPGAVSESGAGAGAAGQSGGGAAEPGAVNRGGDNAPPEGAGMGTPAKPTEPPRGANESFGAESPLIDKAGNIRLDNLNTPEDVSQVIREAAAQNDDFLAARRGVISDAQVLDLADALGMDATQISLRHIGQAFNAEQVMAARKLLIQSATDVRDVMAKAAEGTDADLLAYAKAKARHVMIQEQVSGVTAEAGRALRAFRAIEGEGEARAIGDFLKDATGRTLFQLREEAKLGAQLETPAQVSKYVRDTELSGWGRIRNGIISYFVNNLISGPITHGAYSVGNTVMALWKAVPETALQATSGAIREAFGGAVEDRVRYGEVGAQLYGLVRGGRDGIVPAVKAIKTGVFVPLGEAQGALDYAAMARPQAIPGPIGYVLETPSRVVTGIHTLFYTMNYAMEMARQAHRDASSLGLRGSDFDAAVARFTQSPPQAAMDAAHDEAMRMVLMKRPAFGGARYHLSQIVNNNLAAKIVMPFLNIGMNILQEGLVERTPLAMLSADARAELSGARGQAAFDLRAGKIAGGSMLAAATVGMAIEGLITGGGPVDRDKRRVLEDSGWKAYSLKWGDTYIPYRKFIGPLGPLVAGAADMYEVGHTLHDEGLTKAASALAFGFGEVVADETWMSGLSNLIDAARHWDTKGEQYIRGLAFSFVPFSSALRQTERLVDPYQRQARTILDTIRANTPFLSEGLQPQIGIWGQPIASHMMVSPSTLRHDPVDERLIALDMGVTKIERKVRGVELTDAQYTELQRTAGRYARIRMEELVRAPGFSALPEQFQRDTIRHTISDAREAARDLLMMNHFDLVQKAMDVKRAQTLGVPAR